MSLRRMITRGAAALVLTLLAVPAQAADMSGTWAGAYGYEDGRPAVFFTLSMSQNGKIITGHITETQTFGSRTDDAALRANIIGSVDGHVVTFTKTYDGTGGQRHSVTYRGTFITDDAGRFMFGTWRIAGDVGSWFAAVIED